MKASGFVFFEGPSQIDGAPIVGIAVLRSTNRKTGDMVQTFILRANVSPLDALRTGADASICGACKHRPDPITKRRTCYVDVAKSVSSVWRAYQRGRYPTISRDQAVKLLSGRTIRMGAYGDPAAIPADVWQPMLDLAAGHTGYTHQWREGFAQPFRGIVMASADSPADRDIARAIGWRTFRVIPIAQASTPLAAREIACPASPEGGMRRTCLTCRACDGAARGPGQASIAIIAHGAQAKSFV